MNPIRLVILIGVLVLIASRIHAEKIDLPPARLADTATHIIVGAVTTIYATQTTDKEWATTSYLAEVRIKTVEKGGGLKAGELVYARAHPDSRRSPERNNRRAAVVRTGQRVAGRR